MTATEKDLLQALTDLDAKVRQMATANPKPNLLPIFTKIDELAKQLPPGAPQELTHYLQRKSYEKARQLLLEMEQA